MLAFNYRHMYMHLYIYIYICLLIIQITYTDFAYANYTIQITHITWEVLTDTDYTCHTQHIQRP